MQAEMSEHLGYDKHDPAGNNSGNSRNGKTTKTLKGDFGEMPLETPRDRSGSFEPKMVAKGQTRFTGFDDKILSMYARGMSTREITGHLEEIYGVEVAVVESVVAMRLVALPPPPHGSVRDADDLGRLPPFQPPGYSFQYHFLHFHHPLHFCE
jgi:transposase-like protein